MDTFDPVAEFKKNKIYIIAGAAVLFVLTFILSVGGGGGKRPAQRGDESRKIPLPEAHQGILLDYSDPQLAEDRLRMPEPHVFFTRPLGANGTLFERSPYALDDSIFEDRVVIRETRRAAHTPPATPEENMPEESIQRTGRAEE